MEARKNEDTAAAAEMRRRGDQLRDGGDLAGAEAAYREAAVAGDVGAMEILAFRLYSNGRDTEAEVWYRRAIENGSTYALLGLGTIYYYRDDLDQAERWFRSAAAMGDTHAQHSLGRLLEDRGQTEDAKSWYQAAAESGDTGSMLNLGLIHYAEGDLDSAERWFRPAAESGNDDAMYELGLTLKEQGNLLGAREWYRRAAEVGNTYATEALPALVEWIETDRLLGQISFETFGWERSQNVRGCRQWQSSDGTLVERYYDFPPDFLSWDAERIREQVREMQEFMESPTFTWDDLPEVLQKHLPSGLPQQISLLDVDLFQVGTAKGVVMTSRHRAYSEVHYAGSVGLLFADCFWMLGIELSEGQDVGEREAAVARTIMNDSAGIWDTSSKVAVDFSPYDRKWDGLVPLEDDPLSRLRIMVARLVESLDLADETGDLLPFNPTD